MRKIPVDNANRSIQIEIKDNCAGISIYPQDGVGEPLFQTFIDNATVRVELVRKSQPNAVLYTMLMKELYEIWQGFFKTPKGVVVPFAFKDNLLLNKDSYLQVDINWTTGIGDMGIKDVKIQNNTVSTSTNVPISFKKIDLSGELEVDTEHFEYVFIPNTIDKIETFIDGYVNELTNKTTSPSFQLANGSSSDVASKVVVDSTRNLANTNKPKVDTGDCCCSHEIKRQKIEMDFNYMSYMSSMPTETNVLFKTQANQKIKFFGEGVVTLMQA